MQHAARRRYPRASVSIPCAVDDASGRVMRGRLWSATCDGVGIEIDADDLAAGTDVRLTFRATGEAIEVPARIVWQHHGGAGVSAGAIVALDAAPADVPATYATWLLDELRRARGEALRLGAGLAIGRHISLATLQEALDAQAVQGGSLPEILRAMGVDGVDDALATVEPPTQPASSARLSRELDEWAQAQLAARG